MDLLARIRYILESIRPEARAVIAALDILTRMARHSVQTTEAILGYPRLMDLIFEQFLPSRSTSLCKYCLCIFIIGILY